MKKILSIILTFGSINVFANVTALQCRQLALEEQQAARGLIELQAEIATSITRAQRNEMSTIAQILLSSSSEKLVNSTLSIAGGNGAEKCQSNLEIIESGVVLLKDIDHAGVSGAEEVLFNFLKLKY